MEWIRLVNSFNKYGINILDEKGELRDTYDILIDISNIYWKLSNRDRNKIKKLVVGDRLDKDIFEEKYIKVKKGGE